MHIVHGIHVHEYFLYDTKLERTHFITHYMFYITSSSHTAGICLDDIILFINKMLNVLSALLDRSPSHVSPNFGSWHNLLTCSLPGDSVLFYTPGKKNMGRLWFDAVCYQAFPLAIFAIQCSHLWPSQVSCIMMSYGLTLGVVEVSYNRVVKCRTMRVVCYDYRFLLCRVMDLVEAGCRDRAQIWTSLM